MYTLDAEGQPTQLYQFQREFAEGPVCAPTPHSNFLKGVKWSPDGLCLLTACDDNWFRIYDTPPEAFTLVGSVPALEPSPGEPSGTVPPQFAPTAACRHEQQEPPPPGARTHHGGGEGGVHPNSGDSFPPALRIEQGELIYDYAWFPAMVASDPITCCFASTSRAHPVHLWDACTGQMRCTYRAYNAADEVTAAYSLCFDPGGGRLLCGYNRAIRTFDVARPGREYSTLTTYQKGQDGQPGIISCLALNPDRSGLLAAGAYSGVAALYDTASRSLLSLLEGHTGGLTQVQFSADGNYLYTGARRDPCLYCWDVRYNSGVLYTIHRRTPATNQRIQFDIEPCGRHLATGGEDGQVCVYDLRDGRQVSSFPASQDTLNGLSFHPYLPMLATASGHRRLFLSMDSSSSDSDDQDSPVVIADSSGDSGSDGNSSEEGPAREEERLGVGVQGCSAGAQGPAAGAGGVGTDGADEPPRNGLRSRQRPSMVRVGADPGGPGRGVGGDCNVLRVWRLPAQLLEATDMTVEEGCGGVKVGGQMVQPYPEESELLEQG